MYICKNVCIQTYTYMLEWLIQNKNYCLKDFYKKTLPRTSKID